MANVSAGRKREAKRTLFRAISRAVVMFCIIGAIGAIVFADISYEERRAKRKEEIERTDQMLKWREAQLTADRTREQEENTAKPIREFIGTLTRSGGQGKDPRARFLRRWNMPCSVEEHIGKAAEKPSSKVYSGKTYLGIQTDYVYHISISSKRDAVFTCMKFQDYSKEVIFSISMDEESIRSDFWSFRG